MSCDKSKMLILIMILLLLFSLLACVFETLPINRPFWFREDKFSSNGESGIEGDRGSRGSDEGGGGDEVKEVGDGNGGSGGGSDTGSGSEEIGDSEEVSGGDNGGNGGDVGGEGDGGGGGSGGSGSGRGSDGGGGSGGSSSESGGNGLIKMRVGRCELCFGNFSNIPLFEIYGAVKSRYLRVLVGEVYEGSVWRILDNSSLLRYNGERIKQLVTNYAHALPVGFQIIPLINMNRFIPSANNPLMLRLLENKDNLLWYYFDQQIFFSEEKIDGDYYVVYMNYFFDEKMLSSASTPSDDRYLNIPSYMLSILKSLALEITEKYGAETPYEKLRAIEDFLESNYIYSKNYMYPPEGVDPVLWFLFYEKRGICIHFNSAFVLLARSLGIPSRLVGGYLIDPEKNYQVVYENQSHAYAEALFEGLGWVAFDATPPEHHDEYYDGNKMDGGEMKPTRLIIEITNLDNIGVKGSTFRVAGVVLDEYGSKVDGLIVKVYLKYNKSEGEIGFPVGRGIVENGLFNVTCVAPLDINVGDYFVIAHTLPKDRYLGSWSDPQIRIMAKTYLSVESPEKVIAGRTFIISGALREEETDIPIVNETVTLTIGSKIYSAVTNGEGIFFINCSIEEPGNYTLLFRFDGSEYYLNSTCEKTLRVLILVITPMTKNPFIRGENAYISGRVHAEDLAGDNEEVLVSLGEINIATVKTDSNGYFNIIFPVPSNYTLGKSTLKYLLLCNGYQVIQEVNVMARTRIIASAREVTIWEAIPSYLSLYNRLPPPPESLVEFNKLFNITAILLDNLNQPIQGATLFLNYSYQNNVFSLNSTTNREGIALFNVGLSVNKEENVSYLLVFAGNEIYLGSRFLGHIHIIPAPRSFIYEFYLFPVIVLASSFLTYFSYKKGWLRKKTIKPFEEEPKTQEVEVMASSSTITKKNTTLTIIFPDIKEPFPPVWGINEKLAIRLEIREDSGAPIAGASLKLSIDGKENTYLESSQSGDVETYLIFTEKGDHKLEAHFAGSDQWNEAVAEVNIKIVDYREEVVNLFNSFFDFASKTYQGINNVMTAREFQFKLASQIPNSKHGYLEDLVSTFEVADYSLHAITRREYERMFLAKLNLER